MKGIEWGKPTEKERALMLYLSECIADWVEAKKTDRRELICAFSLICHLIFSKDTPIKNVDDQCKEIDAFCEFLKLRARSNDSV